MSKDGREHRRSIQFFDYHLFWVAFIIKGIPLSDYKLKKWKIWNISFKGLKSMGWDDQLDWESKTVTQKKKCQQPWGTTDSSEKGQNADWKVIKGPV